VFRACAKSVVLVIATSSQQYSWDGRPFRHNRHGPRFTDAGLTASVQQAHDGKLYVGNYGVKDTTLTQQA